MSARVFRIWGFRALGFLGLRVSGLRLKVLGLRFFNGCQVMRGYVWQLE